MKKVFIKCNPYKLETDITVDEKELAQNSVIKDKSADVRLQEWVEEFPRMLIDEYNDKDFDITFHGTALDYEDLNDVFNEAQEKGDLSFKSNHEPAKETKDKESLIDGVFKEIQEGPIDELRDKAINNAFRLAKSDEFEVCVVATMSAGKSTLINALLRKKLMPSMQEACTAIITRIKDTDETLFKAEVYDEDNQQIEIYNELTYSDMEQLNNFNKNTPKIKEIKIFGDIPFVESDEASLVLIDTPGPDNSRNPDHKKVQEECLSESSKSLILYIMTGDYGTNDDDKLLEHIADSMKIGGKQSRDRFIFVINKFDDRKKEDRDTNKTLEDVRLYLKKHGIANPNLFPASALAALNIRLIANNDKEVDEDTHDETEVKVKKLNRNKQLHLEEYSTLPSSIREEIKKELDSVHSAYKGPENENQNEALIHTGIPSIEAMIRQYVNKYAKTAKIKNIVDTFTKKLEEIKCFEEVKKELAENQGKKEEIIKQIDSIRGKINNTKDAKKFKDTVDEAVVRINDESKEAIEKIIKEFQGRIQEHIDSLRGKEIELDRVKNEVANLIEFAKKLEPNFQAELERLIVKNLNETSKTLIDDYKKKLAALGELSLRNFADIAIDPLKLMSGAFAFGSDSFSIEKYAQIKQVEDGKEWVENTNKKWYKPWTWLDEEGYYRTKYKTLKYIEGKVVAQDFLGPVKDSFFENGENARKFALKQAKK